MQEKKRVALSDSRINTYRCPYRFREKVFRKFYEMPNPAAARGKWAHSFFEVYIRHLIATGQTRDIAFAEELFTKLLAGSGDIQNKEEFYFLTVDYARRTEFHVENLMDAELAINLSWNLERVEERDKIWFRARIDLFGFEDEQTALVDDFKTSWRVIPEGELENDSQAILYAWTVFTLFPEVERVKVRFRFVRYRTLVEAVFNRDIVCEIEPKLREMSDQIESRVEQGIDNDSVWPPVPGEVCTFCQIRCPLIDKLTETGQMVSTPKQAIKMAQEYIVLDKEYEQRKRLLKNWVDGNGPIEMNGKIVGYKPELRKSYDVKTILDTLMGMGMDVSEITSINSDGMKHFIKAHPNTAGLFETNKNETAVTKFGIHDPVKAPKSSRSKNKTGEARSSIPATDQKNFNLA